MTKPAEQEPAQVHTDRNNFDVLIGILDLTQRRLRERLKGSSSWEESQAKLEVRKVLATSATMANLLSNRWRT